MRTYPNAAQGLHKVFLAQILPVVGVVLVLFSLSSLQLMVMMTMVTVVLTIVSGILNLMGLYQARQDDQGYANAFYLVIATLVVNVLSNLLGSGFLSSLLSLVANVLNLAILYLVCATTSLLLTSLGQEELARKGHTVWMINLVCTVITVACDLLAFIPVINLLTVPIMLVTLIAALIGSGMYILFIYRASKALA